ncbi:MAG: Na+/H+ antiporter subunit E [Desulfobacteraceae bacterium]|jgi:multicomponent Na+:H+ antiporter subunit E|nr:Na+/H+ antiporter subunit E [Desulfobacteraceae bacterium]
MNLFLLNIFLALGFSAVLGQVNLSGFISGFAVGYAALWLTKPLYGETRYFERLPGVLRLIGFFGKEMLVSNLKVLWDVLTPRHISRPGIIGLPLDARTDLEIMLVANLISLTPGTLSLDLSEDRRVLYIHVMFLDDIEKTRQQIKQGLERRLLEVMR